MDCNGPRYRKEAADCSWLRTLGLFAQHPKWEGQPRLGAPLLMLRHMSQLTKTKARSPCKGQTSATAKAMPVTQACSPGDIQPDNMEYVQ